MMVRLIGPTGIESRKPLRKPVRAATTIGGSSAMGASGRRGLLRFLLVFLLDLAAHSAGDARADEAVNQVKREEGWQHVIEDSLPEDQNEAQDQGGDNRFGKRALRAQSERLETGIFHGANHHGRKEQEHDDQQ